VCESLGAVIGNEVTSGITLLDTTLKPPRDYSLKKDDFCQVQSFMHEKGFLAVKAGSMRKAKGFGLSVRGLTHIT